MRLKSPARLTLAQASIVQPNCATARPASVRCVPSLTMAIMRWISVWPALAAELQLPRLRVPAADIALALGLVRVRVLESEDFFAQLLVERVAVRPLIRHEGAREELDEMRPFEPGHAQRSMPAKAVLRWKL